MALSLGPIKIAKRQWKKPWSTDPLGQDDDVEMDHEKDYLRYEDDRYDYDSSPSSRATSNSLDPMLQPNNTRHPPRMASAYDDGIPRRKFNRYFTLVLGSLTIIFILSLTRLGYKSDEEVVHHEPPPKPWPYESFPFLQRYHGGIRDLVPRSQNKPEYPGDEEELRQQLLNETLAEEPSVEKRQIPEEETKHNLPPMKLIQPMNAGDTSLRECFLDKESRIRVPSIHAYDGVVRGFPEHVVGSYDLFGLQNDICFDRFGRLGPYGLGYSTDAGGTGAGMEGDVEDNEQVWAEDPEVDFTKVRWADVISTCAEKNGHLFAKPFAQSGLHPSRILRPEPATSQQDTSSVERREVRAEPATPESQLQKAANLASPAVAQEKEQPPAAPGRPAPAPTSPKSTKSRTCVVIRTWYDHPYEPESLMALRALFAELSLASGTEYIPHFLIHVKNNDLPIWSDDEEYQRVLNESLPQEFRGMGTLWSDAQLMLLYPAMDAHNFRDIHLHGSYRSIFMPMQYFANMHPEYDYFWHWEMDIRYTGHLYDLIKKVEGWAKEQPRKGLWERNARYYVPSVHGSWEDFRQMVRVQTEHGTSSKANIWNPQVNTPAGDPTDPSSTVEKPIWGPERPPYDDIDTSQDPVPPTTYAKDNYAWGVGEEADLITFNPLFDPENTGWFYETDVTGYNTTDGRYPPRRTAIITASRLSHKLLRTMHRETLLKKHTMFSEMWPGSCALHHGFKAVYAPHPVYIDRRWPTDYLAAVFNGGRNGATGGARTTVFGPGNEWNLRGVSWWHNSGFSPNLWKRWLGQRVDNDGGPEHEIMGEGRMCLPPMLIHPVKNVEMNVQRKEEEKEKEEVKEGK